MPIKLNLIAAACENMGIGKNNNLPWRLKSEMEYFSKMTKSTVDSSKKNIVIMGRRTWDSIPKKYKPLDNRINFVLSRSNIDVKDYKDVYAFKSFDEALKKIEEELQNQYDTVWVIGGSHIYKESMESKSFFRLYMTEIRKNFDCDTFFPPINRKVKEIRIEGIPEGVQVENGIEFVYKVYENINFEE